MATSSLCLFFENKIKDWKNHKGFCKLVKNKAKVAAVPIPIPIPEASRKNEYTSKPQDKVAKEKVDEWTDYASAGKRMESELRQQYLKHGKSFAEWWDVMTLDLVEVHPSRNNIWRRMEVLSYILIIEQLRVDNYIHKSMLRACENI